VKPHRARKTLPFAFRERPAGPKLWHEGRRRRGGYAQIVPMEEMNLAFFTGDFHADFTSAAQTC